MSSASASRTASTNRSISGPYSSSGFPGSYKGRFSSRRSRSCVSAPDTLDAPSARRSAPKLVEPSRSVPPIPTTRKRLSLWVILFSPCTSCSLTGGTVSRSTTLPVFLTPKILAVARQEPSKEGYLLGGHPGERSLLDLFPATGYGNFEGSSTFGEINAKAPGIRRIRASLDKAAALHTPEHLRNRGGLDPKPLGQLASP